MLRRLVGYALLTVIALAACSSALADEGLGAFRHGKHVSRAVDPALAVRTTRGGHADASLHRRGAGKAWAAGSARGIAPGRAALAGLVHRPVDTLPGHWGSRHLIV